MTTEMEPLGAGDPATDEAPTTVIETTAEPATATTAGAPGPMTDAIPAWTPAGAPASAPSAGVSQPAEPAAPAASPTATSRGRKVLGATGQVAGVIGIVVSLLLIIGVLLVRGWMVDQVTGIEGSLDGAVTKGVTLADQASSRVSEVSGRIGAVADAAAVVANDPNPAPQLTQALLGQLSGVSDRYLALRQSYAGARESVVSGLDRLQTLDRLLPFFALPQGPVDALQGLDQKAQALDAAIMGMLDAPGAGAVSAAAGVIAEKASNAEANLTTVATELDGLSTRLRTLQADLAAKAGQVRTIITLVALLFIAGLLYMAFLHVILFRSSRGARRGA